MAKMDGYDYDSYTVYINLPPEYTLDEVILAGVRFLDGNGPVPIPDPGLETEWNDSHYI